MTRGNQRETDRARAAARAAKQNKQGNGTGSKVGAGSGADHAAALAAKIEKKKKLAEEGKLKQKNVGDKYVAKKKVESVINPHTGKKDPKLTEKMIKKGTI